MPNRFIPFLKLHKISLFLVVLSTLFYYVFGHILVRTDFTKLISLLAALFILCYKLIQFEKWNFRFLLVVGILFRLIFFCVEPNLSQDFYRFIWDGQLIHKGINPYLYVPNELIEQANFSIPNAQALYTGMGELSAKHYSNYPPLNQILFSIASFFGGPSILGTVIAMRSSIILADVGILFLGRKLLKKLSKSPQGMFWYFLNPLIIIELTGNLHFEGFMLLFFVASMYFLLIKKWWLAAIALAFSISIKLVPLLFLPLYVKFFGWKKSIGFYSVVALGCLLLFLPFYIPEFFSHYAATIGLWFSNFEFNASIFNLAKSMAVYFDEKPWEFIKTYGTISPLLTIGTVVLFTFIPSNKSIESLLGSMLWVLSIYYFIGTTIHPWYICFLVFLGICTRYKYALVWSATVGLSYFAYSNPGFVENYWLLGIEYGTVFSFLVYEIVSYHNKK